jgi:hypothetical protein
VLEHGAVCPNLVLDAVRVRLYPPAVRGHVHDDAVRVSLSAAAVGPYNKNKPRRSRLYVMILEERDNAKIGGDKV